MRIEDYDPNLTPLRPNLDSDRWRRMVTRVERAIAPELARRAMRREFGLTMLFSSWTRPALSAAAAIAVLATVLLSVRPASRVAGYAGLGIAIGYPDVVTAWVETDWIPSVEELVTAMESRGYAERR